MNVGSDPSWFADNFDPKARTVSFLHLDRAKLSDAPFLDSRLNRSGAEQTALSFDALEAPPSPPHLNFIWHTSFCCSTLIAHALDAPGKNLALREPGITMTLAAAKRAGWFARERQLPARVFGLLARRFSDREQILVKPTNTANTLIEDAARLTSGKMLFLYSSQREFLLSIAKKKLDGYIFARKIFSIFAQDGDAIGKLPPQQLFEMSDLQIASLVWQMQVGHFRRMMTILGPRAAALDCAQFLADPKAVLARLDKFFELGLGAEHIETIAPMFARNAKNERESYDAAKTARESEALAQSLGPDLERVIDWSYQAAPDTPRKNPLPNPLGES